MDFYIGRETDEEEAKSVRVCTWCIFLFFCVLPISLGIANWPEVEGIIIAAAELIRGSDPKKDYCKFTV